MVRVKDNKNTVPKKIKYEKMWSTKIKLPKLVPKNFVKIWSVIAVILSIWTNVSLKVHIC